MEDLQGQVRAIKKADAAVKRAKKTYADQKTRCLTAERAKREQLLQTQDRIRGGESTGDVALDIKIMLAGNVDKDDSYHRLNDLANLVALHPGKLILVSTNSLSDWLFGVLPDAPCITWGQEGIEIPTSASCCRGLYATRSLEVGTDPLTIGYSNIQWHANTTPPTASSFVVGTREVVIGIEAVQCKTEKLIPGHAFQVWLRTRALGQPIALYPELMTEFYWRREERIVELIAATNIAWERKNRFGALQHDPIGGLQSRIACNRATITPTETGVAIDFGLLGEIHESIAELRRLVDSSLNELDMQNNPTLEEAAEVLAKFEEQYGSNESGEIEG